MDIFSPTMSISREFTDVNHYRQSNIHVQCKTNKQPLIKLTYNLTTLDCSLNKQL